MENDGSLAMGIALIVYFLVIPIICGLLSLIFKDKN